MKCQTCGAEVPAGSVFCTECGAKLTQNTDAQNTASAANMDNGTPVQQNPTVKDQASQSDSQPAVHGNPQPNNNSVQPGQPAFHPQAGQMNQPMYGGQPNPMGQPMHGGQPNPMGQPMYGGQPNQMGQPMHGGQPNQMGQPMHGGQPNQMGQPMHGGQPNPMGQPIHGGQPNQMGQPVYGGQPNPMGQSMYGDKPKAARKPLTNKQKKILIGCGIGAVVLIVFFALILPILTRAKLKGAYKGIDFDCVIVFEGDSYVVYEDDDYDRIYDAGTFDVDGSKVTMESISGKTTKGTFNKKKNNLVLNSYDSRYKSLNKKKKIGFEIDDDFLDELEKDIEKACKRAVKDEDVYNQARYNYYYFSNDDLDKDNRREGFEDTFAKELGYDARGDLKTLMELKFINIEISFDSDCRPSVRVKAPDYYGY